MRKPGTRSLVAVLALSACLALAGCDRGNGEEERHRSAPAPNQNSNMDTQQPAMSGMNMGDPSATPADRIPGATLRDGRLKLLKTRPPGMDSAAGSAWMATHLGGTTVTVRMTGLNAGDHYIAHVHALHCAQDDGGEHFRFDPQGAELPPNEIHLAFTADRSGRASMTVNNDRAAHAAKALVVHPTDAIDNRIACADF